MRVLRVLKRTLAVLAFVCMTLKIQLELRVLREGRSIGGYSPWWGNETLGHLRAFPKLATRPNVTLSVLRTTTSDRLVNALPGYANLTRAEEQQGSKSDPKSSNRKILSDATNKSTPAAVDSSGPGTGRGAGAESAAVSSNSRSIEHNVTAAESPSNHKTRAGIFAKLRIYDGENTIDTDTIYSSQKREVVNEKANTSYNNTSIAQSNVKKEPQQGTKLPKAVVLKQPNGTKVSRRSLVPMPKIGQRSPQSLAQKVKSSVLKGVSHDVDKHEMSLTKEEIAHIKEELTQENERQTVYNKERFGPVLRNTTILLVQVHKRLENLRYLVASLRAVRGIEEAVVIFSHDFWDPDINAFVRNITQFRVMQMFFPFSIQLYPLLFPGRDPTDCSWNIKTKEGKEKACLNANWPDSYGHYREASFTQIKHHWWWKIHRMFEGLRVTQTNYTGHVVFLEEDHYASPDLLHVLGLLQRLRPALCPSCKVLALGNYNKMNPNVYKNFVERGDWWVAKYNLGFAMDAAAWRLVAPCKAHFCNFDDYNWDWTLTNVAQTCHSHRLSMLAVRLTRVLHVGTCGTHVRKKVCDVKGEVRTAVKRLASSKQWLFPEALVLQGSWKGSGKPKKGNGGWGDYRDKQLCLAIGNNTANEPTLARLQSLSSL